MRRRPHRPPDHNKVGCGLPGRLDASASRRRLRRQHRARQPYRAPKSQAVAPTLAGEPTCRRRPPLAGEIGTSPQQKGLQRLAAGSCGLSPARGDRHHFILPRLQPRGGAGLSSSTLHLHLDSLIQPAMLVAVDQSIGTTRARDSRLPTRPPPRAPHRAGDPARSTPATRSFFFFFPPPPPPTPPPFSPSRGGRSCLAVLFLDLSQRRLQRAHPVPVLGCRALHAAGSCSRWGDRRPPGRQRVMPAVLRAGAAGGAAWVPPPHLPRRAGESRR